MSNHRAERARGDRKLACFHLCLVAPNCVCASTILDKTCPNYNIVFGFILSGGHDQVAMVRGDLTPLSGVLIHALLCEEFDYLCLSEV